MVATPQRATGAGVLAALGLSLALLASPSGARAWCRASVDTPPTGPCIETEGSPLLRWTRGCLEMSFHESMFTEHPNLDEQDVRFIFEESFLRWEDVDCGFVPFVVQFDEGVASTGEVEFLFGERNESVVVAMTPQQWLEAEQSPMAFAVSFLWHDTKTGELFDVDMGLNLAQGPFGKCGDRRCTNGTVDLQNTITHEAGHVLGLGHSTVEDATMTLSAMAGDIFMRDLEPDDMDGLCALELLSHDCTDGSLDCQCPPSPIIERTVPGSGSRCTCTTVGPSSGAPWSLLLLVTLVLTRLLRRRD